MTVSHATAAFVICSLLTCCITLELTCPAQVCACKITNTSNITDCSNSLLTDIPQDLDTNTTVLNVSNNNISHIRNLHIDKVLYNVGQSVESEDGVLRKLTELKELHFEGNLLASIEPGTFDGNKKLVVLNLGNNNLSSVPVDIVTLKNRINELDLGGNFIQSVDLSQVQKYYPAIKRLDVSRNKVTHFYSKSPLDNSTIEIIDVSQNYIIHLNNTFSNATKLKALNISNNELSYLSPDIFSDSPDLVSIDVSRNHILLIERNTFNKNPKITDVNMGSNKMTYIHPDTFSNNPHLTKVTVSWNDIQEVHPQTFYHNTNLQSVDMSSNKINSLSPELFQNNPKLKSIDLRSNSLLTFQKNTFNNNPHLEHLLLSKNEHIRFHDGFLLHSTVLKVFDAQHCNLSYLPPGILNKTTGLQKLDLSNNKIESLENITDLSHDGYSDILTKLEILDLSNNRLKRINVEVFQNNMTNLKELHIAGNSFLCDCELRSLWLWSQKNGIIPSEPQIECSVHQQSVPWDEVATLNCSNEFNIQSTSSESISAGGNAISPKATEGNGSFNKEESSNKIMIGISIFILLAVVFVVLPLLFVMRRRYGTYKVSKNKNNNNNVNRTQNNASPTV